MSTDTIEKQIEDLGEGVRAIRVAVEALSEDDFLGPLGNWTPRDIVAHLIGWNRYYIRGSQQLLEGELPFYAIDPGENYSNVNARLVAEFPSTNRNELLEEHEKGAHELAEYLRSLSEEQWRDSTGVLLEDEVVTIRQTVDWLIEDHHHHSEQIRDLAKGSGT
jgi:hypothetical protein